MAFLLGMIVFASLEFFSRTPGRDHDETSPNLARDGSRAASVDQPKAFKSFLIFCYVYLQMTNTIHRSPVSDCRSYEIRDGGFHSAALFATSSCAEYSVHDGLNFCFLMQLENLDRLNVPVC